MINSIDELRAGTPLHEKVRRALSTRIEFSKSRMAEHYKNWERADRDFQLYVTKDELDQLMEERKAKGKLEFVDIHVPYSYALLMSFHTYLTSVFLSRSPVLQFAGRHGEGEMNVNAIEAIMEYQTTVGRHGPVYYNWLFDGAKYGVGIVGYHWSEEYVYRSKWEDTPVVVEGVTTSATKKTKRIDKVKSYCGNRMFNIRPKDYYPDPRVPLSEPDKGEFVGRRVDIAWNDYLRGVQEGRYFNREAVEQSNRQGMSYGDPTREEDIYNFLPTQGIDTSMGGVDPTIMGAIPAIEMQVEIIPKEWGLGSTEFPETWVFVLAYNKVIIEAHPMGVAYNKFAVQVLEIEPDAYNFIKRGVMGVTENLNGVVNWLVNSHFYSVRRSLNGDFVYDPSRMRTADILDPKPGKRIRIRPEGYGQDIRTMFTTIQPGAEVTQTHLRDTQFVFDIMQKVVGVNESMMGAAGSGGGRKSATEIRSSTGAGVNRIKGVAEYISSLAFGPLSGKMLSTTQEYYDAEQKFKIAGDNIEVAGNFLSITPDMIAGMYDYVPVDGTLPIDRFAMVSMWSNLLNQMRGIPQVAQQYDMGRIFAFVAQMGGLRNIKQFKLTVGEPGGNMVPITGGGNGTTSGSGREAYSPGRGTANGEGSTPQLTLAGGAPGLGSAG